MNILNWKYSQQEKMILSLYYIKTRKISIFQLNIRIDLNNFKKMFENLII